MPTYGFRCGRCGPFDVRRAMADLSELERCPHCAEPASRVFGAPALRAGDPGMRRALDAQERSAHQPAVVTSTPPSRRRTPVSTDPRHARLPRP
ncbi:FmdB family zinc ribbon protein [Pseudonocardia sp. Cha107L01]|uniref:FmdB family zinc ribbon protein n=1 Tax=Pseudonocardia sp. Cha107L01 TaxID=3457576 RepID=UPI00403EE5F3